DVRSLAPADGRFRDRLPGFALAALGGRLRPQEIEAEVTAQIRKLQSAGLTVTHLDSHKHTHTFPAVLEPVLRAARACGVSAIRNPVSPAEVLPSVLLEPSLWTRYLGVRALGSFAREFERQRRAAEMRAPDGSLGLLELGCLDEPRFRSLVSRMPEGTWEFCCHPGYNDPSLAAVKTRLRQ